MQVQDSGALAEFVRRVTDYLPTLAGGLLVVALGVVAGWVAKRLIVRILTWLRLDRLAGRVGWRAAMGKGDVRAALYELVGNITFIVVVLIFLDNALQILGLLVLSRMLDSVVFYLPNLGIVALIAVAGLVVANVLSQRLEDALDEEEIDHARLIAKLLKGVLYAIVGALVVWQLGFARQIVLMAFVITFGAVGVAFAVALGVGSAGAVRGGWEALFAKKKKEK
jgi:hypothetical protein